MTGVTTSRPIATSIPKALDTLIRINKKAIVPELDVLTYSQNDSRQHSMVNNPTTKKLLGELYKDIQYLQQLKDDVDKRKGVVKLHISSIADVGLQFLQDRSEYWDRLGPLPPLVVKKKSKGFKGSVLSLNTEPSVPSSRRKKVKVEEESSLPQLLFDFRSYQPINHTPDTKPGVTKLVNNNVTPIRHLTNEQSLLAKDEQKQQIKVYFKETFDDIKRDFQKEYFDSCEEKIKECLKCLGEFDDTLVENRQEIKVKLYNTLGDLSFKRGYCEQAIEYYQTALQHSSSLTELKFVTLGNIGRVYNHKAEFNKALDIYSQQSRLTKNDSEVSLVFLNIGQCYLSLHQYKSANDCGRKTLKASRRNRNKHAQIESLILLAISQARLNNGERAVKKLTNAKVILNELGSKFLANLVKSAEEMINAILRHKALKRKQLQTSEQYTAK